MSCQLKSLFPHQSTYFNWQLSQRWITSLPTRPLDHHQYTNLQAVCFQSYIVGTDEHPTSCAANFMDRVPGKGSRLVGRTSGVTCFPISSISMSFPPILFFWVRYHLQLCCQKHLDFPISFANEAFVKSFITLLISLRC